MSDEKKSIFDADALKRLAAPTSKDEEQAIYSEHMQNPELNRQLLEFTHVVCAVYTIYLNRVGRNNIDHDSMLTHLLFVAITVAHKVYTRFDRHHDVDFMSMVKTMVSEIIPMNHRITLEAFLQKYLSISHDDLLFLKNICSEIEQKLPKTK